MELFEIARSISLKWYFIKKNIVVDKPFSPAYFKYRVLRPLLKVYNLLLKSGYGKNKPWISPAAIQILDASLNTSMIGLEYGSGLSTRFFGERLKKLISIEDNQEWYDLVSSQLKTEKMDNVQYFLIKPESLESKSDIEKRYKSDYREENENYREYFEKVLAFPDSYFDFILIDGRARVECSNRAIAKLKSGGIFVVDNSERKRYLGIQSLLKDWLKINTTTGLTDTTIWFKP